MLCSVTFYDDDKRKVRRKLGGIMFYLCLILKWNFITAFVIIKETVSQVVRMSVCGKTSKPRNTKTEGYSGLKDIPARKIFRTEILFLTEG